MLKSIGTNSNKSNMYIQKMRKTNFIQVICILFYSKIFKYLYSSYYPLIDYSANGQYAKYPFLFNKIFRDGLKTAFGHITGKGLFVQIPISKRII